MSVISYSVSNFSKDKNTLSGRKAMLLGDNVLLRKKNYQRKYYLTNYIHEYIPLGYVKSAILLKVHKKVYFLLQRLQLL